MAGITDIRDNPEYQRIVQRITAMTPDQRAILNTSLADKQFGQNAMENRVVSLRNEADLKSRKRNLGLRERQLDNELDQIPTLRNIGIAGVAASGLFGIADLFESQRRVKLSRESARGVTGLANSISLGGE